MREGWLHRPWRLVIGLSLVVAGLAGCDYWPPALQAQIEQLRAEAQAAAAALAKLEGQLNETSKLKEDLQRRVEELTRLNQELTGRVASLEQNLLAEREKAAKLSKPAKKGTAAKSSVKAVAKKPAKKRL